MDSDAGNNSLISFSITGGSGAQLFSITEEGGEVFLGSTELDHEVTRDVPYVLIIAATDAGQCTHNYV